MIERRKYFRLKINVNLKWKKKDESKTESEEVNQGLTKDISGGGICLMTYKKLASGEKLDLEIALPTGRVIRSLGMVVWVSEIESPEASGQKRHDAGIEFLDISATDREEIKNFVFNPHK